MAERGMQLLEHGIRDMYDAEHRFVDALDTMIEQAADQSLVDGFRRHQRVTKEQIRRLERAFDEIGKTPQREDCPGSKGLISEYQKFVKEQRPDRATHDAFAAEAGLKVEHYEIAAYRTLMNLAQFLGYDSCVRLFRQSLAEEEQAAAELQSEGARLAAELTGADVAGLARRAGGTLFDTVRQGAFVAAETAKSVGGTATKRAGRVVQRAERRGRKAVRSAQAKGRTTRAKTTRAKSTTRAKATRAKSATARRKPSTRPTTRRTTTSRSTARRTTVARKTSTRKPRARATGRRRTVKARTR